MHGPRWPWYQRAVRGSLLLALLVAGTAGSAGADQGEVTVAGHGGAALHQLDGRLAPGGGGGISAGYGLVDALTLHGGASLTVHHLPGGPDGGLLLTWFAGAGLAYALDIIRFVPSLEFAVGAIGVRRPLAGDRSEHRLGVGVQVALAFDYLLTRRLSVGALVRYQAALSAPDAIPLHLFVGPRVTIRFGD